MYTHTQSDAILRNLRKPGETDYKIPKGGAFKFVSGANFLGEILEWTGFAIAQWNCECMYVCVYVCMQEWRDSRMDRFFYCTMEL
jgi:3-oxo-5-alpha-steroid 4-dehydrogenase 1